MAISDIITNTARINRDVRVVSSLLGKGGKGAPTYNNWTVDKFISNFSKANGIAQQNYFDVQISLPPSLNLLGTGISQLLKLTCHQAVIPGQEIDVTDYKHSVISRHLPRKMGFAPLQLAFYCDGLMKEKLVMDSWMSAAFSKELGIQAYKYSDAAGTTLNYEGTITITQYDASGNKAYFAQCIEAFPIGILDMPVSWDNSQIHIMTVSFTYYKWFNYDYLSNPPAEDPNVSTKTNLSKQTTTKAPTAQSPLQKFLGSGTTSITSAASLTQSLGSIL